MKTMKLLCISIFLFGFGSSPVLHGDETTLEQLLAIVAANDKEAVRSAGFKKLESEWVGDIINDDGETSKLRLEYGAIMGGKIHLARMFNNRFVESDTPVYIPDLPRGEDLKSIKTVKELEKHFGESQGFTSGWGSSDRMHWTVGWTFVTKESPTRLRYLSVFGQVSQAGGPNSESPVEVDELHISEGILRPADPNSEVETKEYPTGEALFIAREEEKKEKRKKYPLPLRKLVEADEHPDDSDLVHYRKHLNEIRKNPDPELFRQLISVMHEGTLQRSGNLEAILVDSWHELDPWEPDCRKLAIETCIASIPSAKDSAVSDLMVILLKTNGGGAIEIGSRRIEVTVNDDGWSARHGSATKRLSMEETQQQLLQMLIKK